jgi:hypothetical protein
VCFESLDERIVTTPPCGHALCLPCLMRLRAPVRCPMCRAELTHLLPIAAARPPPIRTPPSLTSPPRVTLAIHHNTQTLIDLLDLEHGYQTPPPSHMRRMTVRSPSLLT